VAIVTSGVTNGLPSRSPPTQLPMRTGTALRSTSDEQANSSSNARTSASRALAPASISRVSRYQSTVLTSSRTEGRS
jgi:hypothetical protein